MTLLVGLEVLARALPSAIEAASVNLLGTKGSSREGVVETEGVKLDELDLMVETTTDVVTKGTDANGRAAEGITGTETLMAGSSDRGTTAAVAKAVKAVIEYLRESMLKRKDV